MDKEQEAKLNQEIADLKKQNAEFAESTKAAEAKATEAADKSLRAEIKTFCESNKLNTNKHKEMRIEDILFAAAKANQTIEFSSTKDGKEVKEQKPLLAVLQETLKGFQVAQPKEGEMTEFSQKLPDEKAKNDIDAKVTKYYNDHKDAKEFAGITQKQAEYNILRNHLAGQITL